MKLRYLILVALAMALFNLAQAQDNCRLIETTDPKEGFPITAQKITQSGEYCLTGDLRAPRTSVFSEGGERTFPNYMLSIAASNVVVDLHGFILKVDTRGMGGIESGYWKDLLSHQKITIRNGALKSRSASVIRFNIPDGSLLSDFKAIYKAPGTAENVLQNLLKTLPQSADAYPKTEYLIDHMKIESGSVRDYVGIHRKAIGMKGASNIIRNSTIEVEDGHAAIYLFGPNQLIENNIIIFKGKAAVESAAAIKLHQADGTIIRNNDIIIESSGEDAPKAAISLIDSKNVVVEGNRIYGIKTLMYAWDDKSMIIDRNNDFRSMLRRP
ncbi:MAG: hypothetical protein NVSMB6_22780 [Burkholderiaceae bacterium]